MRRADARATEGVDQRRRLPAPRVRERRPRGADRRDPRRGGCPASRSRSRRRVVPEFREYDRASTTVINAGIQPIVQEYLDSIEARLRERGVGGELLVMQSGGGVLTFEGAGERPVFIVESGPAAGVIATSHLARTLGLQDAISFDMGGTTAKVGLVRGGQPQITREYHVGAIAQPGLGSARGAGLPDPDARHRTRRDRRGRRLDRLGRHRRRAARRADERGRRARAGRLRPRRHRAHGHRRQPRARAPGRRLVPRGRAAPRRRRGRARDRARVREAARGRRRLGRVRHRRDRERRDGERAAADVRPARPRPADVRARRLRRRGPGPREPAGVRDGRRHDDPAAEPRHVLGAGPAAQRPAPRLLPDVPAADRDGRHGRDARDLRAPRGRRARDAPARAGARRRRRDRVRRRDAVRGPELHARDPAAERDADRRRHGRRRAGVPRRPRPRLRLQRAGRADRRSSTCASRPSGGSRRGSRAGSPSTGPRPEPKQTRPVYFEEAGGFVEHADLRPRGARARRRP